LDKNKLNMEFFINKGATLNKLKLELIQDGRNDFNNFFDKIQNANIFFSMTDIITGVKKIAKKEAGIELVEPISNCVGEEYYLVYQFSEKETSVSGRYNGQFLIEFLDGSGSLIVPIKENLIINVLDQGIKK
jgi:hypothetical protein